MLKLNSLNTNNEIKKIAQYSLKGKLIKVWPSKYQICKQNNWVKGSINSSINKSFDQDKYKTARGYMLFHVNGIDTIPEQIRPSHKVIVQFDIEGNFIKIWEKTSTAAKELGIQYTSITAAVNKRIDSTGGFQWRRYQEVYKEKESE